MLAGRDTARLLFITITNKPIRLFCGGGGEGGGGAISATRGCMLVFLSLDAIMSSSGGSKGGAREAPSPRPYFGKKEEITESQKGKKPPGQAEQNIPPTLIQGLDPPLLSSCS